MEKNTVKRTGKSAELRNMRINSNYLANTQTRANTAYSSNKNSLIEENLKLKKRIKQLETFLNNKGC